MPIEYIGEAKMFSLETQLGTWKINLMGRHSVSFESPDGVVSKLPVEIIVETFRGIEGLDPLSTVIEEPAETELVSFPTGSPIELEDIPMPEDAEPPTQEELEMLADDDDLPENTGEDVPLTRPTVKMDDSKKIGRSIG